MTDHTFVYVDGESHFHRSQCAWQRIHGQHACLSKLRYRDQPSNQLVLVDKPARVFWTRRLNPNARRAHYFTSVSGDDQNCFRVKQDLRAFDLEPSITIERKALADRRAGLLKSTNVIEKPKGVDMALAVQVLQDAFRGAFGVCHLYTSDADFAPVVEAVRARDLTVHVHGFLDGIGDRSPFLHVADSFTDLELMLRDDCILIRDEEATNGE